MSNHENRRMLSGGAGADNTWTVKVARRATSAAPSDRKAGGADPSLALKAAARDRTAAALFELVKLELGILPGDWLAWPDLTEGQRKALRALVDLAAEATVFARSGA